MGELGKCVTGIEGCFTVAAQEVKKRLSTFWFMYNEVLIFESLNLEDHT